MFCASHDGPRNSAFFTAVSSKTKTVLTVLCTSREKKIFAGVLVYEKKIRGNHAFCEIIKLQFGKNAIHCFVF